MPQAAAAVDGLAASKIGLPGHVHTSFQHIARNLAVGTPLLNRRQRRVKVHDE